MSGHKKWAKVRESRPETTAAEDAFVWGSCCGKLMVGTALRGEEVHIRCNPGDDTLIRRKWTEGLMQGVLAQLLEQCDPVQRSHVEKILKQVTGNGDD